VAKRVLASQGCLSSVQLLSIVLKKYLEIQQFCFCDTALLLSEAVKVLMIEESCWRRLPSDGSHLFLSACVWDGTYLFSLEVHTPYIHGDSFDCDLICSSCGMLQFCCMGNLFVVLDVLLHYQISPCSFVLQAGNMVNTASIFTA
jgi:hypothetical protein